MACVKTHTEPESSSYLLDVYLYRHLASPSDYNAHAKISDWQAVLASATPSCSFEVTLSASLELRTWDIAEAEFT